MKPSQETIKCNNCGATCASYGKACDNCKRDPRAPAQLCIGTATAACNNPAGPSGFCPEHEAEFAEEDILQVTDAPQPALPAAVRARLDAARRTVAEKRAVAEAEEQKRAAAQLDRDRFEWHRLRAAALETVGHALAEYVPMEPPPDFSGGDKDGYRRTDRWLLTLSIPGLADINASMGLGQDDRWYFVTAPRGSGLAFAVPRYRHGVNEDGKPDVVMVPWDSSPMWHQTDSFEEALVFAEEEGRERARLLATLPEFAHAEKIRDAGRARKAREETVEVRYLRALYDLIDARREAE